MVTTRVLEEVLTLTEAVTVADRLGHPLDRNNLVRYAKEGRLVARKSGGTWLTTRAAVRDLVVSLEAEKRGRPRQLRHCLNSQFKVLPIQECNRQHKDVTVHPRLGKVFDEEIGGLNVSHGIGIPIFGHRRIGIVME